ncbi:hypothetical protein TNCV_164311 [Trichonephila clavipes]|nr:hypothetical protein TNCV_164311 [Trichonephila clavipes]
MRIPELARHFSNFHIKCHIWLCCPHAFVFLNHQLGGTVGDLGYYFLEQGDLRCTSESKAMRFDDDFDKKYERDT